ncbi:killer cell lectin-like receptor subfamily B member 1B allele C [Rhineura floridana]|uniref:killer cell lectin-like receptor subfamily B member 1B allele C n=1 Tax=Rhineura floridana TaxID=261503 RepID=UPI002AC81591|nr:killer cell lectin-like receptor subfamily B member 1B allele C [Rhineura floridana]
MAGEIVYADINIASEPHSSRQLHPSQQLSALQPSHQHQFILWAGCIGNVILMIAVIVLALQLENEKGKTVVDVGECNTSLDKFQSLIRSSLCNQTQSRSSVNSTCRLYPVLWHLHRDKCYWPSEDTKTWDESQHDCASRNSQLLVIQDKEEMDFIKNIIEDIKPYWIGLNRPLPEKKWVWITGTPLDHSLSTDPNSSNYSYCGSIKNKVLPDNCKAVLQWVCQKDSFLL